jgi:hypothetical protein
MRLSGEEHLEKELAGLEQGGHPVMRIVLEDLYEIGAEFFRWEMATALAAVYMGINPFDQPNVESAKVRTKKIVELYREQGALPEPPPGFSEDGIGVYADFSSDYVGRALLHFLSLADPGRDEGLGRSYVALCAFLHPNPDTDVALGRLASAISRQFCMAVTVGYGPRYLHSTGQLHKGDGGRGLFIQLIADTAADAPIPDKMGEKSSGLSFGVLNRAQAFGDRQALLEAGRRVLTLNCGKDALGALEKLSTYLES